MAFGEMGGFCLQKQPGKWVNGSIMSNWYDSHLLERRSFSGRGGK